MKQATVNQICAIRCLVAVTHKRFFEAEIDCVRKNLGGNEDHVGAGGAWKNRLNICHQKKKKKKKTFVTCDYDGIYFG